MLEIIGNQKVAQDFCCILCDYKTSKKSNYTKKDHKLFITNFTQIMKEMK